MPRSLSLDLNEQHRVPQEYSSWLEEFLRGRAQRPPSNYDFRVVSSPEELVEVDFDKTQMEYSALLTRISREYDRRFP
jgi:hypothetical protein